MGDSIGRLEGCGVKMFVGDFVGAGASVGLPISCSFSQNVGCDAGGGVIHSIGSGVGRGMSGGPFIAKLMSAHQSGGSSDIEQTLVPSHSFSPLTWA